MWFCDNDFRRAVDDVYVFNGSERFIMFAINQVLLRMNQLPFMKYRSKHTLAAQLETTVFLYKSNRRRQVSASDVASKIFTNFRLEVAQDIMRLPRKQ